MKQNPAILRRAVGAMFFMAGLCFSSWASRIATIQEKLSLSEAQLGAVLFALPVGLMLSLPLAGWAVTKVGSRIVVAVSLSIYGLALVGLGYVDSIELLAANLVLFGLGSNAVNISVNTQAVATEVLYKRPIMASFHGLWSLAGFTGASIGTLMIGQHIEPAPHFIMICAITIVSIAICWNFMLDDKGSEHKKSGFVMPDKFLITLGLIAFCSMVVEGAMFDWSTIYFKKVVNAPGAWVAAGYTAGMCTMAGGRFVADSFSARFGLKRTLQISGLLSLSGLLIVVVFPYLVPAIIGLMFVGAGISSVVPMVYSAAGKSTTMQPGPAIAAVSTISFVGFLVGPPVIGFLAELSSLKVSFLFLALMALLVIVFTSRAKI